MFTTEELLRFGTELGARSLGLDEWPTIDVDLEHRSLAGVAPEHVLDALVSGCDASVVVASAKASG